MADSIFEHPLLAEKPTYLELYYRYYDLIKLKAHIQGELASTIEYSSITKAELIQNVEKDLQALEMEEEQLTQANLTKPSWEEKNKEIEQRRLHLFIRLDKYNNNAWKNNQDLKNENRKFRIQLKYCQYLIEKVLYEITNLNQKTDGGDPFLHLRNNYLLNAAEQEMMIYLYFICFESALNPTGYELLSIVYGWDKEKFTGQKMLFIDSVLRKQNLIQVVAEGFDHLSNTYAISEKANLIISGLHKDYPYLNFEWLMGRPRRKTETIPTINESKFLENEEV